MNAHRIFSGGGMWRAALVCAWALAGMAAAHGQTVEEFNKTATEKMKENDWNGVIAACNSSLALDPKQAPVLNNRGFAEMHKSELPAALDDFNSAIGNDPKFAAAYSNRAIIEEDEKAADADFKRATELDPKATHIFGIDSGIVEYSKGEPWYERAELKEGKGDLEGAVADVSKAIALDPKNADYYEWRASEEGSLGNHEAAFADDKRSVELDPRLSDDPDVRAGNPAPAHSLAPAPADQSAALRITLDIQPELGEDADIRKIAHASRVLDCSDPDAHFCLVVENVSSKPVVLEPEQTHVLYFEVTDEKGATFSVCRSPPLVGEMPGPSIILAPKEKTVIEIHYAGAGNFWFYPFPRPAPGASRQVTIRAVLQFKPGPDPGHEFTRYWSSLVGRGFWTGRVVSQPCKVTLKGAREKKTTSDE